MTNDPDEVYDVVIVGSGVAGAMVAKRLGTEGKRVLILEAGPALTHDDSANLKRYYESFNKFPSSAYLPAIETDGRITDPSTQNAPRPILLTLSDENWQDLDQSYLVQSGPLAFASTYERTVGGTALMWLGASLRHLPSDFRTKTQYGVMNDWPISYQDLSPWYDKAEIEMGVSADREEQSYLGVSFSKGYEYPMPPILPALIDGEVAKAIDGKVIEEKKINVTRTPMAINSRPYHDRPACSGHSSCVPICPSQAKYDPRRTLKDALDTGNVEIWHQAVAYDVVIGDGGHVSEIKFKYYDVPDGPVTYEGSVKAKFFVLAANGIETPKLLLMSKNAGRTPNGVANTSGQVGRNLMDHPLYLAWGLAHRPVYPLRGPHSISGIESYRDGDFRKEHAAFRIEIGNIGWNFPYQDPKMTMLDFISGSNITGLNPDHKALSGEALVTTLHDLLSRQFHLTLELEQNPEEQNRVTLSSAMDNLGIPRPQIHYDLSDYTKRGMMRAKKVANAIFDHMGAKQYTRWPFPAGPTSFSVEEDGDIHDFAYFGGGHIAGTCCMGSSQNAGVVDTEQKSWDHPNLYIVGSSVFPTIATANPTLTIAAMSLRTAAAISRLL